MAKKLSAGVSLTNPTSLKHSVVRVGLCNDSYDASISTPPSLRLLIRVT
jgi:hypothetical protein